MGRLIRELVCRLTHSGEYIEYDVDTKPSGLRVETPVVRKCGMCGRDKLGRGQ